jgi:hypothetical protein
MVRDAGAHRVRWLMVSVLFKQVHRSLMLVGSADRRALPDEPRARSSWKKVCRLFRALRPLRLGAALP